jgi:TPP-dependent 2-oxoacid decarboxylase
MMEPGLDMVGCCNELNAGYAADGYSRGAGIGCVVVTHMVGGLSVLNAIAGTVAFRIQTKMLIQTTAITCRCEISHGCRPAPSFDMTPPHRAGAYAEHHPVICIIGIPVRAACFALTQFQPC